MVGWTDDIALLQHSSVMVYVNSSCFPAFSKRFHSSSLLSSSMVG